MQIRLPIAYAGAIGYYQKIAKATHICFEIQEHYIKQTLRNRAYILGPNGIQPLIIPVIKVNGSKTAMKDLLISYKENWARQHLHALETAYSSSAYFEHYVHDIAPIYLAEKESLLDFNLAFHHFITKSLGITEDYTLSEHYDLTEGELDLRQQDEIPLENVPYQYYQLFNKNRNFEGNLSILDALFNLGPMARKLLIH